MIVPHSDVDDAPVFLDEGVSIKAGLYRTLTDLRGQEIRRVAEGLPRRSVKEKARLAGIRVESYEYLFPFIEKQAKQVEELQRQRDLRDPHNFEGPIARAPQEKTRLAAHRIPSESTSGSRIDWEAVPGYEDEKEAIREEIRRSARPGLRLSTAPACG